MKTVIYVMTHKACTIPDIPGYVRMQVGAALHEDLGYLRDDEGEDHISDLNPYFSELTGMYSIWRNLPDADYVGICHYRRFFINEKKQVMTGPEYEALLADADMVAAAADIDDSFAEVYARAHRYEDLKALGDAIRKLYPEDYPVFEEVIGEKRCTYGNLCVMPRELFAAYCAWLFQVLMEAGERICIDELGDDHQKRVFGFLSEPLPMVFARAKGLRLKECPAAFFAEKAETAELKNALRYLTREGRFSEALDLYRGVLRQRPDLSYREADISGELGDMVETLLVLEKEFSSGQSGLYAKSHNLDELIKLRHKCCVLVRGVLPILDHLADCYAEAFQKSGYEVFYLDYSNFEESAKKILGMGVRKPEFVLAFNNNGFVLEKKDGTDYWAEHGIPAYNLLVDHPMYYADTLDSAPAGGTVLCADRMHPSYIRRFFPAVKKCGFLPTAGTELIKYEAQKTFSQRPIDFLMLGNCKHCTTPDDLPAKKLYALLKDHPELTMEEAAEQCYVELYPSKPHDDVSLRAFIEKYRFIVVELTAAYREELVLMLIGEGYRVETYGDGWGESRCLAYEGFSLHGPVQPEDGIRLMAESKFVINNMAWFKDGGSERIFNAMLQGAIVITDRSRYLEDYYDEDSVLWYELNDMRHLLTGISKLMSDEQKADRTRKRAYEITDRNHRWLHRAEAFLET